MKELNEKIEIIEEALIDSVSGGRESGCSMDICRIDICSCEWPCFFL